MGKKNKNRDKNQGIHLKQETKEILGMDEEQIESNESNNELDITLDQPEPESEVKEDIKSQEETEEKEEVKQSVNPAYTIFNLYAGDYKKISNEKVLASKQYLILQGFKSRYGVTFGKEEALEALKQIKEETGAFDDKTYAAHEHAWTAGKEARLAYVTMMTILLHALSGKMNNLDRDRTLRLFVGDYKDLGKRLVNDFFTM